jgi:ubiquitin-like-conjugating enzyme ATG10
VILVASEPSNAQDYEMNDLVEEAEDLTSVNHAVSTQSLYLEHHIVYSTTYQVPVLYFTVSYSNSTPLSLEEIYQYIVPQSYQHVALSQAEHPILSMPCWYIHPCDTRILMSTLKFDKIDYIKSWLSVQGPLAKCQISMDMFK